MKLGRHDILVPDRRRKPPAVFRPGCRDRGIHRFRIKAVHKIHVTPVLNLLEDWTRGLGELDLVPANLRHLEAGLMREPEHFSAKNAQAGRATVKLFASFEQSL